VGRRRREDLAHVQVRVLLLGLDELGGLLPGGDGRHGAGQRAARGLAQLEDGHEGGRGRGDEPVGGHEAVARELDQGLHDEGRGAAEDGDGDVVGDAHAAVARGGGEDGRQGGGEVADVGGHRVGEQAQAQQRRPHGAVLHELEGGHGQDDDAHRRGEQDGPAPHVVRDPADRRHEEGDQDEDRQGEQRAVLGVVVERRGQVGRHVGGQGVADRVGAGDQDYGGQELAPVGAHHVPDPQRPLGPHDVGLDGGQVGGLLVVDLGPGAAEGRGVLDAGPQVQGDPAHGQGHEEGDAPAPLGHDVLGQDDHEDGDQAGPQGVAHVGAPVEQGGVEAALLVRGVLGDEGGRPGVLPAGGEALDELEADEQDGRPHAEHGARRQDADAEGRQRHHHEGEGEDLLAPQAVPELAQDDAPQGAWPRR